MNSIVFVVSDGNFRIGGIRQARGVTTEHPCDNGRKPNWPHMAEKRISKVNRKSGCR